VYGTLAVSACGFPLLVEVVAGTLSVLARGDARQGTHLRFREVLAALVGLTICDEHMHLLQVSKRRATKELLRQDEACGVVRSTELHILIRQGAEPCLKGGSVIREVAHQRGDTRKVIRGHAMPSAQA